MNIFSSIGSIFTLERSSKKFFSKENILSFLNFIEAQIIDYVSKEDLLGAEKKAKVDKACIEYICDHFETDNAILEFCIEHLLLPVVPIVTQFIYDCLKETVQGLTE